MSWQRTVEQATRLPPGPHGRVLDSWQLRVQGLQRARIFNCPPVTDSAYVFFQGSAMTGSVSFQEALAARLELINPSAADLAGFLRDHPPR